MDQQTKEVIAAHFKALKAGWDSWLREETGAIPEGTERFFIGLTANYFRDATHRTLQGQEAPLVTLGSEIPAEESWKIMRAYFNTVRPRAKHRILDSIFAEAKASAVKENPAMADAELVDIVLILLNRYKLQCRSAVLNFYAPERFGKTSLRWVTDSGNELVGAEDDTSKKEKFDTLVEEKRVIPPEEEGELRQIAEDRSSEYFPTLSDSQKAGLFALFARNCASEKIRFNDPRIAEFVDLSETQFYAARRIAQVNHILQFRDTEIWKNEDRIGQLHLEILLEETLLDESFLWFRRKKPDQASFLL